MEDNKAPLYYVWGVDNVAYGPVELPPLVNWIRDDRVYADTWIFDQRNNKWCLAQDINELQAVIKKTGTKGAETPATPAVGAQGIKPASLRRIKILAGFNEDQLTSFARYLQVQRAAQFSHVFRQGSVGDTMFMIVEGELRVSVRVNQRESILATLGVGESFGEMALLDEGKRSADVIANVDCMLLSISKSGLEKLFAEAPALAAPFLHELAQEIAGRLRTTNRRLEDSVRLSQAAK